MPKQIEKCFGGLFSGLKVLVTGHTGFKGSWLTLWLDQLGAKVVGYSLEPPTEPNLFSLQKTSIESKIGDLRDLDQLRSVIETSQPDLVIHLAAQPLVRLSYADPIDTITSNVTGTLNVLEATRNVDSVRAILCVTSDKVYENFESSTGYTESARLGGSDPYSCSKACAELLVKCWRDSFRNISSYGQDHNVLIATARAGNVIGGGDWAQDRLIPDAVRSGAKGESLLVRSPHSVRPWQHVLESLSGYLLLSTRLLGGDPRFAQGWNFGPSDDGNVCVSDVVEAMQNTWPQIRYHTPDKVAGPHETKILKLDASLAQRELEWLPVWDWRTGVEVTTRWYREYYEHDKNVSLDNLENYIADAASRGLAWAS